MVNKTSKKHNSSTAASSKHLHSRISYLFQAAQYLSAQPLLSQHTVETKEQGVGQPRGTGTSDADGGCDLRSDNTRSLPLVIDSRATPTSEMETGTKSPQNVALLANPPCSLPSQLVSHLRAISLKCQIRLSTSMKRSICKCCCTILIPGQTARHRIDNRSRGGRKPWADVLVIHCNVCGTEKRFPVGASTQSSRAKREQVKQPGDATDIGTLQDHVGREYE